MIRLLGPVEVVGPGGLAELAGARRRAVVGLLALRRTSLVSVGDLVDALWGEEPPRTAVKSLHSHVARIRQSLHGCGLEDPLRTRGAGYQLVVEPCDVDAERFEAALRCARDALASRPSERTQVEQAAAGLRDGLAMWRGAVLADTDVTGWGAAEIDRLHQMRLAAHEELWHAELLLGGHTRAIIELERLLADHPLRERVARLLMLALYRSGRQADALVVYDRLRGRLAEQLGIDPAAESQKLHLGILRRDPALASSATANASANANVNIPVQTRSSAAPRPAQLPAPAGHFTGRGTELAVLDSLVLSTDRSGDETRNQGTQKVRIGLICGSAGMGKTALAVEWAHSVADRFPDGQIYLECGGGRQAATPPAEAMARVLAALGVVADRIPGSLSEQTDLYRSTVHDRRILILADDVADTEQLLPLVPPTASSLLVATSRFRLAGLAVQHDVCSVEVEALDPEAATALLTRVVGAERVAAEPEPAAEIVERCGRMPLALRIVAARLAARPRLRIADLIAELDEERLDALSDLGDTDESLRAVFHGAYDALSEPAARTFRALGLHPGPTFSAHLAGAATGDGVRQARRAVAELAAAHMISEVDSGRFRFHDLIRLYAQERAKAAGEDAALGRILDWYLGIADAANRVLTPSRDKVNADIDEHRPPFEADRPAVLAFLDGERDNLVPVVARAAAEGVDPTAWQTTYLLAGYFTSRGLAHARVEMCRHGLAAAEHSGDQRAQAFMRTALGVACNGARLFDEAIEQHQQALVLMRAAGDVWGEGATHNNLAVAYGELGRYEDAADAFDRALRLHEGNGDARDVAVALSNIAHAYTKMGRPRAGLEALDKAMAVSRELGDPWLESIVLQCYGQAYLRIGDHEQAVEQLRLALQVMTENNDQRNAAITFNLVGDCHRAAGDPQAALTAYRDALRLSREIADPHREALALTGLGAVLLDLGDQERAREHLQLGLALRARVPDASESARLHGLLGALDDASGGPAQARQGARLAYR